jgi:hypothetical protein
MRKNKIHNLIVWSEPDSSYSDDSFNSSVDSGEYIYDKKDAFVNQNKKLKNQINKMEKVNPLIKNKIVYKQYDFSKENPFLDEPQDPLLLPMSSPKNKRQERMMELFSGKKSNKVNPFWHNIRKTVFQNVKKDTIKPPSVKTIIQRINFFKTEF